jgi:hypothetical protein
MSNENGTTANTVISGITSDTRTQGRGRLGVRGGRGNNNANSARSTNNSTRCTFRPQSTGFKGTSPEMNGNVFECYDEQTDRRQFAKTVEALQGYVKKSLKYSEDLSQIFAPKSTMPVLANPVKPGLNPDGSDHNETDIELWKEDIKDLAKRRRQLRGILSSIMAIIWGESSEAMKAKVKSCDGYTKAEEDDDCIWLLANIKAITMQFDAKHN